MADMSRFMTELNLNGETEIPAGKVANIVTYLEMHAPPQPRTGVELPNLTLEPVTAPSLQWYRSIYSRIGEDWLWYSRVVMSDDRLKDILNDNKVDVFVLKSDGQDAGLLELNLRSFPDIELAFFGLVPEYVGGGAGRWLMTRALQLAWAHKPKRVWLHTCSYDHPAALPFYIRSGFTPYKRTIDIDDDPRLSGKISLSAAKQIPVIRAE